MASSPSPVHAQARLLRVSFVGALGSFLLGLLCFKALGPRPFNQRCIHFALTEYTGCFTWVQFWASLVLLLALFAFAACTCWCSSSAAGLVRKAQSLGEPVGQGGFAIAILTVLNVLAAVLSFIMLISPGHIYQTDADGNRLSFPDGWTIDIWHVQLGIFIAAALGPLGIALIVMVWHLHAEPTQSLEEIEREAPPPHTFGRQLLVSESESEETDTEDSHDVGKGSIYLAISLAIVLVFFAITMVITPIWNFSQSSYMLSYSKYSWAWLPLGGVIPVTDKDQSGIVDFYKCTTEHEQCPWLTLKIFTDTSIFFISMLAFVVACWFMKSCSANSLRRHGSVKLAGQFEYGTTGLQSLALLALAGLACFWAVYWFAIYGRFWELDITEDLWPLRGAFGNYTVEKSYDMWYSAIWGNGPLPPFYTKAWTDQQQRPGVGANKIPNPVCSVHTGNAEACLQETYCYYDRTAETCTLATCTAMSGDAEACHASESRCRWVGDGAHSISSCIAIYEGLEKQQSTGRSWLHIACRASGHMASLFMSLTVLLGVKSSPLLRAIGLSWEELLPFHRALGWAAFTAVTVHMLLWWTKWTSEGTFFANIFPSTNFWLWITPTWNHFENWSVLMVQYSWFLLAGAIACVPYRRTHYRLFYMLHHSAVFMALMGIVHAWAFVHFILVGLLLWWLDRLVRLVQSSENVSITKLKALQSGATHLELHAPRFARRFRPSQYGFVRVSEVDAAAYHPFTANVVGDRVTFFVKDMGSNWTHDLKQLAGKAPPSGAQHPTVSLFGPFGGVSARFWERANPLVLVAGGIGITPVASVFADAVLNRRLPTVYLVWINQSVDQFELPLVREFIEQARGAEGIQVRLYFTRATSVAVEAWSADNAFCSTVKAIAGRPKLDEVFDEIDEAGRDRGEGATFACGPAAMSHEVIELGQARGYGENHFETFLF